MPHNEKTEFLKPRLSNSYNKRCSCCPAPIHKTNSSGLCTDCAVHLRHTGEYQSHVKNNQNTANC